METWVHFWAEQLGTGWQDFAISILQWCFALSLIPAVRHPTDKPAFLSSIFTASLLLVMCFVLSTLGFVNSTLATFAVCGMWVTLAVQKHMIGKQKRSA